MEFFCNFNILALMKITTLTVMIIQGIQSGIVVVYTVFHRIKLIVVPEAAGKVILSTSKGWFLTIGRDLQINLLHPLFGYKISLPSMLAFPRQPEYSDSHTPEDASAYFISKVAMSSSLLEGKKDATPP